LHSGLYNGPDPPFIAQYVLRVAESGADRSDQKSVAAEFFPNLLVCEMRLSWNLECVGDTIGQKH